MEVETEQGKSVMCLFTDPEGTPLGGTMYLPQNVDPLQLQQIVNTLLKNVTFFLPNSLRACVSMHVYLVKETL